MATRREPLFDEAAAFDWDTFVARWWQRRVVVFRGAGASPFAPADAFAAAVEAGRHTLAETYDASARRDVQFTLDGEQQAFLAPWLPIAADRDFAGYTARLAGALAGRRHALVISGFHSHAFALWSRERALLAGLWRRIGLPLTGAITTLFHGDYDATPAGVHKDRFTTFLFALSGRKRMRFWPSRPWTEPVSTITRYDAHLASSFTVEVAAGDILYWPASYYHIGESAGGLATSVNIGIPIDEHHAAYYVDDLLLGTIDEIDLSEAARRRARFRPGRASPLMRGALSARGDLSATLPAALRGAVAQFQRLLAPRETARQIRRLWLARQTAAGLEPAPPPAPVVRIADADQLRGDRAFPVLLAPEHGRDGRRGWLCAASGHTVRVVGHVAVPALCTALASGRAHRVAALLRPFGARAPAIRRLLAELVALRALERIPAPG